MLFLDKYELLDIIGNGSFGIIRKVRRKTDGLVSAIGVFLCSQVHGRLSRIFACKELDFEKMSERDRKHIVAEVCALTDSRSFTTD